MKQVKKSRSDRIGSDLKEINIFVGLTLIIFFVAIGFPTLLNTNPTLGYENVNWTPVTTYYQEAYAQQEVMQTLAIVNYNPIVASAFLAMPTTLDNPPPDPAQYFELKYSQGINLEFEFIEFVQFKELITQNLNKIDFLPPIKQEIDKLLEYEILPSAFAIHDFPPTPFDEWYLREHNCAGGTPSWTLETNSTDGDLRWSSGGGGSSCSYLFKTFDPTEISGKMLRFSSEAYVGFNADGFGVDIEIFDGFYDQASNTDFVPSAGRASKGVGLIGNFGISTGVGGSFNYSQRFVESMLPDTTVSTEGNVTIFFHIDNANPATHIYNWEFRSIEIEGVGIWEFNKGFTDTYPSGASANNHGIITLDSGNTLIKTNQTIFNPIGEWQYKEHDRYAGEAPDNCITITGGHVNLATSASGGGQGTLCNNGFRSNTQGDAYLFQVFERNDIIGKEIKVSAEGFVISGADSSQTRIEVFDGEYRRGTIIDETDPRSGHFGVSVSKDTFGAGRLDNALVNATHPFDRTNADSIFRDDFREPFGWAKGGSHYVIDPVRTVMDINFENDASGEHGLVFDLGAPLDDSMWVMRIPLNFSGIQATGTTHTLKFYISDVSTFDSISTPQDHIGWTFNHIASGSKAFYSSFGDAEVPIANEEIRTLDLGLSFEGGLEVIRDSPTSVTWNFYGDKDFNNIINTTSKTIASTTDALAFVKMTAETSGGATTGASNFDIPYIEIWNATTTPSQFLHLPASAIDYASSTEDKITVFVRVPDAFDNSAYRTEIHSIKIENPDDSNDFTFWNFTELDTVPDSGQPLRARSLGGFGGVVRDFEPAFADASFVDGDDIWYGKEMSNGGTTDVQIVNRTGTLELNTAGGSTTHVAGLTGKAILAKNFARSVLDTDVDDTMDVTITVTAEGFQTGASGTSPTFDIFIQSGKQLVIDDVSAFPSGGALGGTNLGCDSGTGFSQTVPFAKTDMICTGSTSLAGLDDITILLVLNDTSSTRSSRVVIDQIQIGSKVWDMSNDIDTKIDFDYGHNTQQSNWIEQEISFVSSATTTNVINLSITDVIPVVDEITVALEPLIVNITITDTVTVKDREDSIVNFMALTNEDDLILNLISIPIGETATFDGYVGNFYNASQTLPPNQPIIIKEVYVNFQFGSVANSSKVATTGNMTAVILQNVTIGASQNDIITIAESDVFDLTIEHFYPIRIATIGNLQESVVFNFTGTDLTITDGTFIGFRFQNVLINHTSPSGFEGIKFEQWGFDESRQGAPMPSGNGEGFCVVSNSTDTFSLCPVNISPDGSPLGLEVGILVEDTPTFTTTGGIEPDKLVVYHNFDSETLIDSAYSDTLFKNAGTLQGLGDISVLNNQAVQTNITIVATTGIIGEGAFVGGTDNTSTDGDGLLEVGFSDVNRAGSFNFFTNNRTLTDTYSVNLWVKGTWSDVSDDYTNILHNGNTDGDNAFHLSVGVGGEIFYFLKAGDTDISASQITSATLTDDTFGMVSIIVEKSNATDTFQICVDTVCESFSKGADFPDQTVITNKFMIGDFTDRNFDWTDNANSEPSLAFTIDELCIWQEHKLTPSQLTTLYNSGSGTTCGTVTETSAGLSLILSGTTNQTIIDTATVSDQVIPILIAPTPPPPTNVASAQDGTDITVTWTKEPTATGYNVFKYASNDTDFQVRGTKLPSDYLHDGDLYTPPIDFRVTLVTNEPAFATNFTASQNATLTSIQASVTTQGGCTGTGTMFGAVWDGIKNVTSGEYDLLVNSTNSVSMCSLPISTLQLEDSPTFTFDDFEIESGRTYIIGTFENGTVSTNRNYGKHNGLLGGADFVGHLVRSTVTISDFTLSETNNHVPISIFVRQFEKIATLGDIATFTDTNVDEGITNFYEIRSTNSFGQGNGSSIVNATGILVQGGDILDSLSKIWQFKEYDTQINVEPNGQSLPNYNFTIEDSTTGDPATNMIAIDTGFNTASGNERGSGSIFKIFNKTDILNSDITIFWEATRTGTGTFVAPPVLEVRNGTLHKDSGLSFSDAQVINPIHAVLGTVSGGVGSFTMTSDILSSGSIDYAGADEFVTVIITVPDDLTTAQKVVRIANVTISNIGTWNFTNPQIIFTTLKDPPAQQSGTCPTACMDATGFHGFRGLINFTTFSVAPIEIEITDTATVSDQIIPILIVPTPDPVTGLTAVFNETSQSIELSWDTTGNATSYRIFRTSTETTDEVEQYNFASNSSPQSLGLTSTPKDFAVETNWIDSRFRNEIVSRITMTELRSFGGAVTGGEIRGVIMLDALNAGITGDDTIIRNSTTGFDPSDIPTAPSDQGVSRTFKFTGTDLVNLTTIVMPSTTNVGMGMGWFNKPVGSGDLVVNKADATNEGAGATWSPSPSWTVLNPDALMQVATINQTRLSADPQISDTGSNATTFSDTNIDESPITIGNTYFYRLVGLNSLQEQGGLSSVVNATAVNATAIFDQTAIDTVTVNDAVATELISVPDPVTGLSAIFNEITQSIDLSWDVTANADSYRIFRTSTETADEELIFDTIITGTFTSSLAEGGDNFDGICQHFDGDSPPTHPFLGKILSRIQTEISRTGTLDGIVKAGIWNNCNGGSAKTAFTNSTTTFAGSALNVTLDTVDFNFRGTDLVNKTSGFTPLKYGSGVQLVDSTTGTANVLTNNNGDTGGLAGFLGEWRSTTNNWDGNAIEDILGEWYVINNTKLSADPEVDDTGSSATTFSDTNIDETPIDLGNTYFYRIAGLNSIQEQGGFSSVVDATALNATVPPPPTNVSSAEDGNNITITWTKEATADGYKILRKATNDTTSKVKGEDLPNDYLKLDDKPVGDVELAGNRIGSTVIINDATCGGAQPCGRAQNFTMGNQDFTLDKIRLKIIGTTWTTGNGLLKVAVFNGSSASLNEILENSTDIFTSTIGSNPFPSGQFHDFEFDDFVLLANKTYMVGAFTNGSSIGGSIQMFRDDTVFGFTSYATNFDNGELVFENGGDLTAWSRFNQMNLQIDLIGDQFEEIATLGDVDTFTDVLTSEDEGNLFFYKIKSLDGSIEGNASSIVNQTAPLISGSDLFNSTSKIWQFREHDLVLSNLEGASGAGCLTNCGSGGLFPNANVTIGAQEGRTTATNGQPLPSDLLNINTGLSATGGDSENNDRGNGIIHFFKIFNTTEITDSSITIAWQQEANGGSSTVGLTSVATLAVYDGIINKDSGFNFAHDIAVQSNVDGVRTSLSGSTLSGIEGASVGAGIGDFNMTIQTLDASSINWGSFNSSFATVVVSMRDPDSSPVGSNAGAYELFIANITVSKIGTWNFTNPQIIYTVDGNRQLAVDVCPRRCMDLAKGFIGERGFVNTTSFAVPAVPDPVTGLTAIFNETSQSIDLSWDTSSGADSYRIFRTSTETTDEVIEYSFSGTSNPQAIVISQSPRDFGVETTWDTAQFRDEIISRITINKIDKNAGTTGGFLSAVIMKNSQGLVDDDTIIANSTTTIDPASLPESLPQQGVSRTFKFVGSDLVNLTTTNMPSTTNAGFGLGWFSPTSGSVVMQTRDRGDGATPRALRFDVGGSGWAGVGGQDVLGTFASINQTRLSADPEVDDTGSSATTFSDTNIDESPVGIGNTYFYRLVGLNSLQEQGGLSSVVNATAVNATVIFNQTEIDIAVVIDLVETTLILGADPVTGLTAIFNETTQSIDLSWDVTPNADSYRIFRSSTESGDQILVQNTFTGGVTGGVALSSNSCDGSSDFGCPDDHIQQGFNTNDFYTGETVSQVSVRCKVSGNLDNIQSQSFLQGRVFADASAVNNDDPLILLPLANSNNTLDSIEIMALGNSTTAGVFTTVPFMFRGLALHNITFAEANGAFGSDAGFGVSWRDATVPSSGAMICDATATDITGNGRHRSWTQSTNFWGSAGASDFRVQVFILNDTKFSADPIISDTGSSATTFSDSTVDSSLVTSGENVGDTYFYRIAGLNSLQEQGVFSTIENATALNATLPIFNQTQTDIVSVLDDVNATKIGVLENQTAIDIATVTDQEEFDITKLFSDTATTSDQDATTFNPIPDEINDLSAFAVGDTCELTWSSPFNLGDPIAPINGYKILKSIAGGSFNVLVANTSSTLTAFNDTGLVLSADHDYDVRALNKHGEASGSNIDTCVPQPSSPPNSPTLLIATAVGSDVQLDWTASTQGSPTGYFIERKIDGGGFIDLVLDTGSTSTTFVDNTVIPATKFFYRVSAINAFGVSAPSNEASVTTLETPNKPTLFAVQNVNQIDLTWTEPTSDEPINGYRVEKRINLGLFFDLVSNTTNTNLTLTDDNVTAGNTYGYRVRALSSIGTGAVSNVVDVNFGSHVIVEVREQDGTSYKGGGSVIMANSTFSTTQVINGLSNANFDNFEVGNYNFTFIDLDDFILNRTINFPFPSGNLTSTFEIRALVFDVDCPSNGGGTDIRIKVNYTNLHDITQFPSAPVCDSSDKVSWSTTWGGSQFSANSTMIADFISVNFKANAEQFLVSTVPTGTSYDSVANRITSVSYGVIPQIPQTSQTINFDLFLDESPPQGGSGGGGGGTPPFVPSITPRPEDLELTGLSLLSTTHQFAMAGDVIRGFIDIQWEGEDPLTITRITIGDFSGSMVFLNTPRFDIPQSIEGSGEFAMSSGSIAYVITLPPQDCQPEIGLDQNCLIKELFAIPVEFEFEFKGQTVTGSTNVMVDASEIPFDVVQLQVILLGIVLLGSALAGNFIRMRLKKQRKPANKKRRKFKKKFDSS